jgi:hypothetical protein
MADLKTAGMPPPGSGFDARGGFLIGLLLRDLQPLTAEQAAAIPGNFGGESGLEPGVQEVSPISGRGGFGWEQATGSRRVALEQWAADHGLDLDSDEADYTFLIHELTTTEAHSLERLRRTTTLEAATYTFQVLFERPSDPQGGIAKRIRFAQRALAAYNAGLLGGTPIPAEPVPASPVPAPPAGTSVTVKVGTANVLDSTIRLLQDVLTVAGYYTGPIDGRPNDGVVAGLQSYLDWLDQGGKL